MNEDSGGKFSNENRLGPAISDQRIEIIESSNESNEVKNRLVITSRNKKEAQLDKALITQMQ